MWQAWWYRFDFLFPEVPVIVRKIRLWKAVVLFLALAVLFGLLGHFMPADGFIGFDWVHFWQQGRIPVFYPPWTKLVTNLLTWEILIGCTMAAIFMAVLMRARSKISAVLAIFTLPVFWTVFLGQLDGLALVGVLALPWLAPVALIKPQLTLFAFAARRSYLFILIAFLLISFLLFGFWPMRFVGVENNFAEGRFTQNIALGFWGIPMFLMTVWFSRGDVDMLMLSGSFITPYLIPYNMLPITPALARLKPWSAVIGCILSWLPLSSNWLGAPGWWLGWLFIAWLWINLAAQRYPQIHWFGWFSTKGQTRSAAST